MGQARESESSSRHDDELAHTFVVVAAYNEGPTVEAVLRELHQVCPNIVVVDDGSSDETSQAVRKVAPYVLRHAINRGQGAALQTGIRFALLRGAHYVVTFDADGQHRPEDIVNLLAPIQNGECDITLGSRFLGQALEMPRSRRVALKCAVLFTRIASRVRVTDAHNGLRAFSRKAAERINITQDRMAHASELIDFVRRSGLPFKEVPVRIRYTAYSLGKGQTLRDGLRILLHYLVGKVGQ